MGTPYHRFGTLWKIQEFIVFLVQVQGARGAQQRTNDPLFTRPQNESNWKITMQLTLGPRHDYQPTLDIIIS